MKVIFFLSIFFSALFSEPKIQSFTVDKDKQLIVENENDKQMGSETQYQEPQFQKVFLKMIVYLVLFIILSFATIWSLKRMGRSKLALANSNKAIKILEKRMLSPKSAIYLIELDGKKILVSESHLDMKIKILE